MKSITQIVKMRNILFFSFLRETIESASKIMQACACLVIFREIDGIFFLVFSDDKTFLRENALI